MTSEQTPHYICMSCGINVTLTGVHLPTCQFSTGEPVKSIDAPPETEAMAHSIEDAILLRVELVLRSIINGVIGDDEDHREEIDDYMDDARAVSKVAMALTIQVLHEQELLDRQKIADLLEVFRSLNSIE